MEKEMYGSQFHLEQTLNTKRYSTSILEKNISTSVSDKKNNWFMVGLVIIGLTISSITLAGPAQSRLPGGNGNAKGR